MGFASSLYPGILSLPHRVLWDCWETTTTRLQQAGWSLSADQNLRDERLVLAMRSPDRNLTMIADEHRFDFFRHAANNLNERHTFTVRHVAQHMHSICVDLPSFNATPIDAYPQTIERKSIEDMVVFAPSLARTEELIVDQPTVQQLLDQIREMQSPEQRAIRQRMRSRTNSEPVERQTIHAQIISLAA